MEESLKPAGDGAKTATTAAGQRDDEDVATAKEAALTERRRSLFEPLECTGSNGRRTPAELLLPPPDFEAASYPKGWLVGKKRKLVNVDVVESMRRVAVQEMNRKVCPCESFILILKLRSKNIIKLRKKEKKNTNLDIFIETTYRIYS